MRLFLDSSGLAKRYVSEPGSASVVALCRDAEKIVLSPISKLEVLSALNRLRREGLLADDTYPQLKDDVEADIDEAVLVELSPRVMRSAIRCMETVLIRTLDAIHVASAMEAGCSAFLSADRRQCRAAATMGVPVIDLSSLR